MRNLFSTKVKVLVVLAILLSVALAIASGVSNTSVVDLAVKGALAPFRAASTALTSMAQKYYGYMFRYEALAAENEVLKKQLSEMEDTARQAESVSRENQRLRKGLNLLETHEDYKLVDAYIIGWSSSDWENTLTINRGTNSGIQVNMCAITENGEVVGLVTEVGLNYAVVTTILDSTLEISGNHRLLRLQRHGQGRLHRRPPDPAANELPALRRHYPEQGAGGDLRLHRVPPGTDYGQHRRRRL